MASRLRRVWGWIVLALVGLGSLFALCVTYFFKGKAIGEANERATEDLSRVQTMVEARDSEALRDDILSRTER